jgi:hypothetical protein
MKRQSLSLMAGLAIAGTVFGLPALAESWIFMGTASTGEEVYVDRDSISWGNEGLRFIYSIGSETIYAVANCDANTWYANGYGNYSPTSTATNDMIGYVCSVGGGY